MKGRSKGSGIIVSCATYYFLRFEIIKLYVVDGVKLRLISPSIDDLQSFIETIRFVQSLKYNLITVCFR